MKKKVYYSVYFSPNKRIENFDDFLTSIELTIRMSDHKKVVVR